MANKPHKEKAEAVKEFRMAWDQNDYDAVARLLQDITMEVTDGYSRLSEGHAAKLSLKPTKAFRRFVGLCEDPETVKLILQVLLKSVTSDPPLAYYMSKLIASGAQFPKPTRILINSGALDTLEAFFLTLPSLIAEASEFPSDQLSLMIASNLILAGSRLCNSERGLASKWLQAGVLAKLLDAVPFKKGWPRTELQLLGLLEFISVAAHLGSDLCQAAGLHKGESPELASRVAAWSTALLERLQKVFEDPGAASSLTPEPGGLFETCVNCILGLLTLLSEGFKGVFDLRPSIQLVRPMLTHIAVDNTCRLQILEELARGSKPEAARSGPNVREPSISLARPDAQLMTFNGMQQALGSSNLSREAMDAVTQIVTFYMRRKDNKDYRQADLHLQPSLAPLVPLLLKLLQRWWQVRDLSATVMAILLEHVKEELSRADVLSEQTAKHLGEVGVHLLSWLKLHPSALHVGVDLISFTAVAHCASTTWKSLAALLNDHRFLEVCKNWFEPDSRQLTLTETDDLATCILTALRVPGGSSSTAHEAAVKKALTRSQVLTWVFETAAHAYGMDFHKRPNLLPLLALCSKVGVQARTFPTPPQLRLFVRQLARNWPAVRNALLPDFEESGRVLRFASDKINRLAGHVLIVEAMLCGSRREADGSWDPGYLADVRAAVSNGPPNPRAAAFVAFCEAEGVPLLVSIVQERKRLERFRLRAEQEGYLFPEAADVVSRVGAVWELVAAAFSLHPCANKACLRVEGQKGSFMKCGRCKIARYCSQPCQKAHWKAGLHKSECKAGQ